MTPTVCLQDFCSTSIWNYLTSSKRSAAGCHPEAQQKLSGLFLEKNTRLFCRRQMFSFSFYEMLSQWVKQVFTVQTGVKTHRCKIPATKNPCCWMPNGFFSHNRSHQPAEREWGLRVPASLRPRGRKRLFFSLYFQQTYTFSHLASLIAIHAQWRLPPQPLCSKTAISRQILFSPFLL